MGATFWGQGAKLGRYLWAAHLAAAIVLGWGGLTWLVISTNPQAPWARLAFVLALALGIYATACMLAFALCLARWPAATRPAVHVFSRRQGIMWSALFASLALLRLSGEFSAFTATVTFLAFAGAQYSQLRHSG